MKFFHNTTWSVIFIMLRVKSDFYFLPEKPCFTIKYSEKGRKRNCVLSNCSKSRDTWKSYVRFHMYICSWSLYTLSYLLMASTFAFGPIYLSFIGIVFGRVELMGVWIKGGVKGLRRRGGNYFSLLALSRLCGGLWAVSKFESSARAPRLPRLSCL